MMFNPRILRAMEAPKYLGVNVNYFNEHIRPHLTEVKLGPQMICFDRNELDSYVDKLFEEERIKQNKKPLSKTGSKKLCPKESQDSDKEMKSGGLTNVLTESAFKKARKRLIEQRQNAI